MSSKPPKVMLATLLSGEYRKYASPLASKGSEEERMIRAEERTAMADEANREVRSPFHHHCGKTDAKNLRARTEHQSSRRGPRWSKFPRPHSPFRLPPQMEPQMTTCFLSHSLG